jgi:hypothetical protein
MKCNWELQRERSVKNRNEKSKSTKRRAPRKPKSKTVRKKMRE